VALVASCSGIWRNWGGEWERNWVWDRAREQIRRDRENRKVNGKGKVFLEKPVKKNPSKSSKTR